MARKGTSTGSSGCTGTGTSAWTPEALRAEVAAMLGTELTAADDDTDLFSLGLQSIQLMQLTNRINRVGGRTGFTELARDPRLTSWHRLLSSRTEKEGERPGPSPAPSPAPGPKPFPLTPVQQAYWIGRGDDRPLGGVGCHAYLEIDAADVDPGRPGPNPQRPGTGPRDTGRTRYWAAFRTTRAGPTCPRSSPRTAPSPTVSSTWPPTAWRPG